MNSERKTEVLVGLFLLVGLMLLGGIILQFGSIRSIFRDTYLLQVSFTKASGIKQGSPIYLGGSKVGKVKHFPRLNETYTGVIIDLEIFKGEKIPAGSTFTITTAGLMGDAFVDIEPPKAITDEFISETLTEIIPGQEASGLSDLQSAAERIGKQVSSVLEDDLKPALGEIKEAMTKVNKDALSKETIDKFKNAMTKLDTTLTRVDEKLLNEENSKNLKEAIAELKDASTSFKNASKSIEDSSKKLSPLIDKLNAPIEKMDMVMTTADDAMKSIKTAADSFSVAAKNITNGKGLLGALINDAQMKADFHDLIYNAKVNGFVWYKNPADTDRAKAEPAPAPQLQPAKRKSLFGN